ncbi:MAG: hypothetical protein DLM58_17755 [Pseudonocardiales bacterium]|nr:MAG: hypothetical protein DLM58_17755 [Pseudonocardiales bacterium]
MIVLIMLVIFWAPYVVTRLMLRAQHVRTRTPAAHPRQACTGPSSGAQSDAGSQDGLAWSALDDRQLTRLLIDSAPRTITE